MPSTGGVRHAGSEGTKYVVDEGNRAVAVAVAVAVVSAVVSAPAVVLAVVLAVAPAVHYCRERRSAAADRGWPRWSAC